MDSNDIKYITEDLSGDKSRISETLVSNYGATKVEYDHEGRIYVHGEINRDFVLPAISHITGVDVRYSAEYSTEKVSVFEL